MPLVVIVCCDWSVFGCIVTAAHSSSGMAVLVCNKLNLNGSWASQLTFSSYQFGTPPATFPKWNDDPTPCWWKQAKKAFRWQLVSARRLHDSGSGSAAREASHIIMARRWVSQLIANIFDNRHLHRDATSSFPGLVGQCRLCPYGNTKWMEITINLPGCHRPIWTLRRFDNRILRPRVGEVLWRVLERTSR